MKDKIIDSSMINAIIEGIYRYGPIPHPILIMKIREWILKVNLEELNILIDHWWKGQLGLHKT